jgi:hypothetical protein
MNKYTLLFSCTFKGIQISNNLLSGLLAIKIRNVREPLYDSLT